MTEPAQASVATGSADLSFREIVETHKRALYYLALDLTGNHHDAEDLSQEVFIKAHRGLQNFRGDAQMYTWLRRIAINTYLNKKRKKALTLMRFFGDDDEPDQSPSEDPSPFDHADGANVRQHIERALKKLSPRERTAFTLRHHQDMSTQDVADSMEVASGTVKSLLFRATRKLQEELSFLREERQPTEIQSRIEG